MQVLNFCILYAKYYIYIQRLFNNNTLDLYTWLNQIKQVLKTDENIFKKNNNKKKPRKYNFIYENLYLAIMKILYVIMYLRLCIHCPK